MDVLDSMFNESGFSMNLQLSFMYCNILVNPTFLYYYAKLCHKRFKKMFHFPASCKTE